MKNTLNVLVRPLLTCILIISLQPVAVNWASEIKSGTSLSALIEEGQTHNQELKSIEERIDALEAEVSPAGALDDPRLGFALLNLPVDSLRFDQEPMTQKQVAISQKFPWFGTLGLKEQSAVLKAVKLKMVLKAEQLALTRKITDSYYQIALLDRSLEITDRLTALVEQLLRVSETKYASGMGLQQDVFQAQVELSKLLDEKLTLTKQRRVAQSLINEMLNRPSYEPIIPVIPKKEPSWHMSGKTLREFALSHNPWLKVRIVEINQAEVDINIARKDYFPDFDVKVAYGQRNTNAMGVARSDFITAGVTLTLPLWKGKKQDQHLIASKKRHEAAKRSHQNLFLSLPHRIDAKSVEIETLLKNYRLYRDALIVQADQWAQSSLSAYEVGQIEFNTMLNAQIRLLRLELQADRYRFGIYRKKAEIEEILGDSLAAITSMKQGDSQQTGEVDRTQAQTAFFKQETINEQ
jgi:outer membrane protein TolC